MLTTSSNQGSAFTGGSGNDTFAASANNQFNSYDSLTGGDGTDTLSIEDLTNVALTLATGATLSSIETLTINHSSDAGTDIIVTDVSNYSSLRTVNITNSGTAITDAAGGVNVDTNANVTSVTISGGASAKSVDNVDIADGATGTADTLTTVSLTGIDNATVATNAIASDSLTSLTLNNVDGVVTNTDSSAADTRALTVNYAGGSNGGVTDAGATTATINVTAATTAAGTNTFAAATTVNVAASAALTAGTVTATSATALNLSGSAAMTLTQSLAAGAVITNTSTAAVTLNTAIAAGQQYVGGSGVDTVSFAATGTKASTLGAGDDVATFTAVMGTGGSVDAGDGTDTVSLAAADAVTLTAASTFAGSISGFERASIGAYATTGAVANAADSTISLANLDNINYVTVAGVVAPTNAQTYTISGFTTGGTYAQTALIGANATQALTGSFTGGADSFTLKASATNGFVNAGALTLANVETVSIVLDDTDTTAATTMFDLNLDATSATSITVTGDAGITFVNSSYTALRTMDASGVTATGAAGVVTFTANAGMDTVIKGGAGNDVLAGNSGNDTITGGNGADTITGGAGNDTIVLTEATAAIDTVVVGAAASTNADTISGFTIGTGGDKIKLTNTDTTGAGAITDANVFTLSTTAVNAANEVIGLVGATYATAALAEAALTAYAGSTITATNDVIFFYSNGTDAFIYKDANAGTTTAAGADLTLIATLTGVTSVANMVVGNFDTFA